MPEKRNVISLPVIKNVTINGKVSFIEVIFVCNNQKTYFDSNYLLWKLHVTGTKK